MNDSVLTDSVSVKYNFSTEDMLALGQDQARHLTRRSQLEDEMNTYRTQYKARLAALEADISLITSKLTAKYEQRNVRCLILKFRPDNDSALIVRTDNGRVIRKRRLDQEEKQISLTTEAPLPYAFEVDLYNDTDSDVADCAAENVPLTVKEVEELKDAISTMRPLRKMIEAPKKGKNANNQEDPAQDA